MFAKTNVKRKKHVKMLKLQEKFAKHRGKALEDSWNFIANSEWQSFLLHCVVSYCTASCYVVLHHVVLNCVVRFCCVLLYCVKLHCVTSHDSYIEMFLQEVWGCGTPRIANRRVTRLSLQLPNCQTKFK